jgi:DNA repair exonuclease SbcCD ATPase subunit
VSAQAQAQQATEEVARLVEDAERRGRETTEARNARAREAERALAEKVELVEAAARRQREEDQRELATLRAQMEEEQRQRSAFEQQAALLQTEKERLSKVLAEREEELASKCTESYDFFASSLGAEVLGARMAVFRI